LAVHDETGWREDIALTGDLIYSESALYAVDLTLPGGMIVAASGTEVGIHSNPDGTMPHTSLGPGLRDFALAFGQELRLAQKRVDGIAVNVWHLPDNPMAEAKLKAVTDAVRVFDERFG
jgi:hypothetical protein